MLSSLGLDLFAMTMFGEEWGSMPIDDVVGTPPTRCWGCTRGD